MAVPTLVLNRTVVAGGGTLTVPATCDVLISRTNTTVGGVAASNTSGGWYWWLSPPTGDQVIAGASTWIGWQNGLGGVLEATSKAYNSSGLVQETMTGFADTTVFIGIITADDGGPTSLRCNLVAMTYFTGGAGGFGYSTSAINNPVCDGRDSGASHGVAAAFLSLDYGTGGGGAGPVNMKKISGVLEANVKKISGVALADIKKVSGVS